MKPIPFMPLGAITARRAEELKAAAARVIDSGRYINGPEVAAFERELADKCGVKYAVGVSNGLDALRLIFRAYIAMGLLHEGDEVIVPANTYIASVLAVTDSRLRPVFVEPDPSTMNLNLSLLPQALTPRTRAIMVVHLYGTPCWSSELERIAAERGLLIVEDNAQAIGALYGDRPCGSLGNAAGNSFYPTKNLGAIGDAGAVTTDDEQLAVTVRAIANYGSDRRYHNIYRGFNCRLDEMQAALLRVNMRYLDEENSIRRANAAFYADAISNPLLELPASPAGATPVWHQYVVRCAQRDRLRQYLADHDIATDVLYPTPPHLQPCYYEYTHLSLPIAERLSREVMSLPVSSALTAEQAGYIARTINDFR